MLKKEPPVMKLISASHTLSVPSKLSSSPLVSPLKFLCLIAPQKSVSVRDPAAVCSLHLAQPPRGVCVYVGGELALLFPWLNTEGARHCEPA